MRFFLLALPLLAACDGGETTDTDKTTDTSDTNDTGTTNCVEENGACILEGSILEDMTLTADKAWLLRSAVTVGDDSSDVTLTIEPGTTVYGESATNAFLVISRGAKLHAEGTASAPITFTSDQAVGSRARGDWGGIALNGRAPINACADGSADCEAEGEGGTGLYGGSDATDSSGVLKYVRVEYGGTEISPDNEINGIGFQGVGSGTEVDYVQVHRNLDDGMEFFGGTVTAKHLVVTDPGDDGIDWDLGFSGKIQYAVVRQASDAGNNGFETDSNADDNTATPVSMPTVANVTLIGDEGIAEDNFGMVLRRGSAPTLANIAVTSFSTGCLAIRDQATFDFFAAGDASISHTIMACAQPYEEDAEETEVGTEDAIFEGDMSNQNVADLMLTNATGATPDFRPTASSPLVGAGQSPSDSFFDATTYVGAFDTSTDWTSGWTVWTTN